jgi:hypothetical protein
MRTAIFSALAAAAFTLAGSGCAGHKVVLLGDADYRFTRPGDVVAGIEMKEAGIWYRKGAHEKLQNREFLPWDK